MEEPKIHRKETRKWLEVKYTPEELSDMSMELARKNGERQKAEDQKKSANSQFKSDIDALTAKINELSRSVVTGSEMKNVKCEVAHNYENGRKTIMRLDTMEFIFDGEIPDDEKQMEMDLDSELEKDKKAHEELVGHEIDENLPVNEQSSETESNDTPPEQTPSDAPETEESQEPSDTAEPEKESPLIYESGVGPKAKK